MKNKTLTLHKCPLDGNPCDGCASVREPRDAAFECWLNMSDADVLARTRLSGEDPKLIAARTKKIIMDVIEVAGMEK